MIDVTEQAFVSLIYRFSLSYDTDKDGFKGKKIVKELKLEKEKYASVLKRMWANEDVTSNDDCLSPRISHSLNFNSIQRERGQVPKWETT